MEQFNGSLSDQFGRFVATTSFESLPRSTVSAVIVRILDLLAASCAGISAGNHTQLVELLSSPGSTTVWGTNQKRSLRDATVINSAVAHSTYFEDGSRFTGGHPSSAIIPAALALAIDQKKDGKALIAAVAVGYELFLRLGHAIYPSTVNRGFQSTPVLAAPATAAAASVLLNLSEIEASHAISIACSQGVGLKEALFSANSQPLQVGRSSEGGLFAALYAARGATGSSRIFEKGFLKAFADNADHNALAAGLGQDWHTDETYLKQHGGCRGNHVPVDTVLEIMEQHQLTVNHISRIDLFVDSVTFAAVIEPPANAEQAQFSIAFSVAARLITGDLLPERFSDDELASSAIRDLMSRITVVCDLALNENYPRCRPAIATVTTNDGRSLAHRLDFAKGEPETPLSRAQIEQKFERLASQVFGRSARRITEAVSELELARGLSLFNQLLAIA